MSEKCIFIGQGPKVHLTKTADAAITPGMLCELTATGVRKHATAGGAAYPMFAGQNYASDNGNTIDDDCPIGEEANLEVCSPGVIVNALIADNENIAIGDFLESNGDGKLREVDADPSVGTVVTNSVVAVAIEALDLTGSSGEEPTNRCKVMVV
jgi:hypothetical protein